MNVVICGAGLLGLKTARDLLSAGSAVSLYEKEPEVGGLCRSLSHGPFTVDLGPHFYYTGSDVGVTWIVDEYRALLGGRLDWMGNFIGESLYATRGREVHFPMRMMELLRAFGAGYSLRAGIEIVGSRCAAVLRPREASNAVEFLEARFGRTLTRDFFAGYMSKSAGLPPEAVDVLWAGERTNHAVARGSVLKFLARMWRQSTRSDSGHWYPAEGGAAAIPNAMAQDVRRRGGMVQTGARLVEVRWTAEGSRRKATSMIFERADGSRAEAAGDAFISTIPLPELVGLLRPEAPGSVKAAAARLTFRSLALLFIVFDLPLVRRVPQVYAGDLDIPFKRFSEPKAVCERLAPPDRTALCFEFCCQKGDEVWNAPADELLRRARACSGAFPCIPFDRATDAFAVQVEHAYPVYRCGVGRERECVLDFLNGFDNFASRGRQGGFEYGCFTFETMRAGAELAREFTSRATP